MCVQTRQCLGCRAFADRESLPTPPTTDAKRSGAPTDCRDLWQRFQIGLLATRGAGRKDQPQAVGGEKSSSIQGRRPDSLTLNVVQGHDPRMITDISHHLVVDEYSKLEAFDITAETFSTKTAQR